MAFELSRQNGAAESLLVKKIVWQSPSSHHDIAVLRLDRLLPDNVQPLALHRRLPALTQPPSSRVYVIGHPNGCEVSFSIQDNLLLDVERRV